MFAIKKVIVSKSSQMLAACILPLCLVIPALCTAVSPANLATRADDLLLPVISSIIDPPEIPLPPPPPAHQGTTAMEQRA
jgi:hypothetical protein